MPFMLAPLSEPIALVGVSLILGLLIGSFLNVVIHRLPRGESVVHPASHCPGCNAAIKPWDNVPVLSYLWLRGRCRSCGVGISLRYPAVELFTGLVFAAIAWRYGLGLETALWMVFAGGLIVAALVDLDHQIIPDEVSLGGLALGLLATPCVRVALGVPVERAILWSAGGALLGGGILWSVAFLHARVAVALGREYEHWPGEGEELPRPSNLEYWVWFPGMGFGDIKLLAMIGAFLGPWGVLETIVAASLIGLVMGLAHAALTRSWDSPFGFGPAIAAGALLSLLS